MSALLTRVIEAIEQRGDANRLVQAADLLCRQHDESFRSGDAEVDATSLSDESLQLRGALRAALQNERDFSRAGTIAWALSKALPAESLPVFDALLASAAAAVVAAGHAMHQCLIAIDNQGALLPPTSFESEGNFSIDEIQRNLSRARRYLATRGVQVP